MSSGSSSRDWTTQTRRRRACSSSACPTWSVTRNEDQLSGAAQLQTVQTAQAPVPRRDRRSPRIERGGQDHSDRGGGLGAVRERRGGCEDLKRERAQGRRGHERELRRNPRVPARGFGIPNREGDGGKEPLHEGRAEVEGEGPGNGRQGRQTRR